MRESSESKQEQKLERVIIIGSSAGGNEPAEILLENLKLPADTCAVYIPHLGENDSYQYLLGEGCNVQAIDGDMYLRPEVIYIARGLYDDFYKEDGMNYVFSLIRDESGVWFKLTDDFRDYNIDMFFQIFARFFKENTIGIILLGTGNDGANGISTIKSLGGVTFAEDLEVDLARFGLKVGDGVYLEKEMPQNAIDTGTVDFVLPIEGMCEKLTEILSE